MSDYILLQKLQAVGFSEKNAVVYLANLKTGTAAASRVAEMAKMNRVTTYGILQDLLAAGFVSKVEKKKTQYFTALEPKFLTEQATQNALDLQKSLPLFQFLQAGEQQPVQVQVFEGGEGIKNAYMQSLEAKDTIYNYANSQIIRQHWPEYDAEYVQKRAKKNIFLKGLAPNNAEGRTVQSEDFRYFREIRLIDAQHFQVENEVNIFDDKVLIASFEPAPFALLIVSVAVAQTQKQIFEIAWMSAQ